MIFKNCFASLFSSYVAEFRLQQPGVLLTSHPFIKPLFDLHVPSPTTNCWNLHMDTVNSIEAGSALNEFLNRRLAEHTDILEMAYGKDRSDSSSTATSTTVENCRESEAAGGFHSNGFARSKPNASATSTNSSVDKKEKTHTNGFVSWEGGQVLSIDRRHAPNEFERCNKLVSFSVYMTWIILMVHAYLREFLRYYGFEKNKSAVERPEQRAFAPLFSSFESVYARNCYMRVRDVFERPIGGVPGATVKLLDRTTDDYCWSFKYAGVTQTEVINVGSYNYLGFSENNGLCSKSAAAVIEEQGLSVCTTVHEQGMTATQKKLEKLVAEFLGVEDAICFSMGFATNSMNAPCLVDKHCLIISDEYNHASLILGCRLSGANINVFKHNDMNSLEGVIRNAIARGNPKMQHKPYKKILIVVEGIYSMEGSISNLPAIIALKKKYNCYLYLDEAHSIGAMGRTGRGLVEYWGCSAPDVDILMGTFTKSFGAAGGYLAGRKKTIDHIRMFSPTSYYSLPMSPPVAQQIYASMSTIMGKDGTKDGEMRIERLSRNARYFRLRLKQMGFIVYGSDDSPVVPIMLYYPTTCGLWGRLMLERKIGVVVVSFPATEMTESRCRICISAAHTKEMLDKVLNAISEVGDLSQTKHSKRTSLFRQIQAKW